MQARQMRGRVPQRLKRKRKNKYLVVCFLKATIETTISFCEQRDKGNSGYARRTNNRKRGSQYYLSSGERNFNVYVACFLESPADSFWVGWVKEKTPQLEAESLKGWKVARKCVVVVVHFIL